MPVRKAPTAKPRSSKTSEAKPAEPEAVQAEPPAEPKAKAVRRAPSGNRARIVRRMWRTAEAQVRDIERRLMQDAQPPDERERDARVLAVLSRTLRELLALDEAQRAHPTEASEASAHDEPVPRDMGELRRSLSRRLAALVAEQEDAVSREP